MTGSSAGGCAGHGSGDRVKFVRAQRLRVEVVLRGCWRLTRAERADRPCRGTGSLQYIGAVVTQTEERAHRRRPMSGRDPHESKRLNTAGAVVRPNVRGRVLTMLQMVGGYVVMRVRMVLLWARPRGTIGHAARSPRHTSRRFPSRASASIRALSHACCEAARQISRAHACPPLGSRTGESNASAIAKGEVKRGVGRCRDAWPRRSRSTQLATPAVLS